MAPKPASELSASEVKRLSYGRVLSGKRKGKPCKRLHAVGGVSGLYLQCHPPAKKGDTTFARSWILRTTVGDHRSDIGLGGFPDVTLGQARERARAAKESIRNGVDPRTERRLARSQLIRANAKAVTFRDIGQRFEAKKAKEYRTLKQAKKLSSQLETYVYPHIGRMVVADIERAHIIRMLQIHWEDKTETMTRVRAVVENVLDMAGAEGLRSGDNPARWKGNLELSLPSPGRLTKVQHFKAMPALELPDFLKELKQKNGMGALALQFGILTAARPGEVRHATWDEIDLKQRVWTIPGERMKNGRTHKVPLNNSAISLLKGLERRNELLFTAPRGGPLSDMTTGKVLRDMGYNVTSHGFRATFRTWAQEYTNYPDEVAELALAHVNSDATRAAYARSELLDKRRRLMDDWDKFCKRRPSKRASVTPIRSRSRS